MQAVCIRKCYWREKLWKPGEIVTISGAEADSLPRHFESLGRVAAKAGPAKEKDKE